MKIYQGMEELIGNTPIVRLNRIKKCTDLKCDLLAKIEKCNPAGSVKDRVALNMILSFEKEGKLKNGSTIIEPTSGNTGIGIAAVSAARGYHAIIVMPDTMSIERIKLMAAYGAEVVLSDGKKGMSGAIERAEELKKQINGSIIAGQFVNQCNPESHYKTTGPEIWNDTEGKIDVFIAGIGTGGTITGIGKYLKKKNSNIKIIGVEPKTSPLLTEGKSGPHGLQGIGANFIPKVLDRTILDEVVTISDEEGYSTGRMLAEKEGLLCGITSGAAVAAAIKVAKRKEFLNKTILALLPDTGERYLSTSMFK